MTEFNTLNPIPSSDVRDLLDNATIEDNFVNGPLDSYPDRFGISRQSLQGIRNASQYQILGPYAAGLEFTSYNQVFSYLGEFYAPSAGLTLPYTTDGSGAPEIANFRSVGDAVLRQDLADSADTAKGVALVGYKGRSVGGLLDEDLSIYSGFGVVGDGVADDRDAIESAIESLSATGGRLFFPEGVYLLNSYSRNTAISDVSFNILPIYSNIEVILHPNAEIVVGNFFDDKRFQVFLGIGNISNVHFSGGTISFSGSTNRMRTAYMAPRICMQFGASYNTSVERVIFTDGDLTNVVAAGSGTDGDMHSVINCIFTDLVQESPFNTDFTALYCNATRSTVSDCHFSNASVRGGEIACAVELHKSNSAWHGGTVFNYTRGCFLVAATGESTYTERLVVSGVKASIVNVFASLWASPLCAISHASIINNSVYIQSRSAAQNADTLNYGVGCLVGSAGVTVDFGSMESIIISGNTLKVSSTILQGLSAVISTTYSLGGITISNNTFQVAHFIWIETGSRPTLTAWCVHSNKYSLDYLVPGTILADFECDSLVRCSLEFGLDGDIALTNVVRVQTLLPGEGNIVRVLPEHTRLISPALLTDSVFLSGTSTIVEYPSDISVVCPAATGSSTLTSAAALAYIKKTTILSRGSLPGDVIVGATLTADAGWVQGCTAFYATSVPGTYVVRALLSNIQ